MLLLVPIESDGCCLVVGKTALPITTIRMPPKLAGSENIEDILACVRVYAMRRVMSCHVVTLHCVGQA